MEHPSLTGNKREVISEKGIRINRNASFSWIFN